MRSAWRGERRGQFRVSSMTPTPHNLRIPRKDYVVPADVLDATLQAGARVFGPGNIVREGAGCGGWGARVRAGVHNRTGHVQLCVAGWELDGVETGMEGQVAVKVIVLARARAAMALRQGEPKELINVVTLSFFPR